MPKEHEYNEAIDTGRDNPKEGLHAETSAVGSFVDEPIIRRTVAERRCGVPKVLVTYSKVDL